MRRRYLLDILKTGGLIPYSFSYLYNSLIPTSVNGRNVGNYLKIHKVYGDSVVENQLVQNGNFANGTNNWNSENGTINVTNNKLTCVCNGNGLFWLYQPASFKPNGHKILMTTIITASVSSSFWFICGNYYSYTSHSLSANTKTLVNEIITTNTTKSGNFGIRFNASFQNNGDTCIIEKVMCIDLTLMFPFDTPTTLTDPRVQALLNRGYIAYNTGEIKSVDISEISTTKADTTSLDTLPFIYQGSGVNTSKDTFEITNTEYVFTKNNAFRPYQSGDEYDNTVLTDLTNTLYQLATPQVIRIPKKHLAVVDLGSLNWSKNPSNQFTVSIADLLSKGYSDITNMYCSIYKTVSYGNLSTDNSIATFTSANHVLFVNDTSKASMTETQFKNAMQGIYLFYETESEVADIETQIQVEAGGTITSDSNVLPDVDGKFYPKGIILLDNALITSDGNFLCDSSNNFIITTESI